MAAPLSDCQRNAPPSATPTRRYRDLPSSPIPGNTTSVNKLINTISEAA